MIFYNEVNLSEVIVDVNTGSHWSASLRAYELFGQHLTSYREIQTEIEWISLIYNKKSEHEVFMLITVDWSAGDWIKAKNLATKQIELQQLGKKKEALASAGIIDDSHLIEVEQKNEFLEALGYANGMLTTACKESRIPMSQYRKWMQSDMDFVQAVAEIRESIIDNVEGTLIKNAKKGNDFAIKYFLDARARDRGYGKETGNRAEESGELDLSLLTYEEQDALHKLLIKAQPVKQKPLMIG